MGTKPVLGQLALLSADSGGACQAFGRVTLMPTPYMAPTRNPESKKPNLESWAKCFNTLVAGAVMRTMIRVDQRGWR
jgi:hypothetical protein